MLLNKILVPVIVLYLFVFCNISIIAQQTKGKAVIKSEKPTTQKPKEITNSTLKTDKTNKKSNDKNPNWIKNAIVSEKDKNQNNNGLKTSSADPAIIKKSKSKFNYEAELEREAHPSDLSLVPKELIDFKMIKTKMKGTRNSNKLNSNFKEYFKVTKPRVIRTGVNYIAAGTGFLLDPLNINSSIKSSSNGLQVPMSQNTMSMYYLPISLSAGYYTKSRKFSFELGLGYMYSTNNTLNKAGMDTSIVYAGNRYITSVTYSTKSLSTYFVDINASYFYKSIILSGRDLIKLFATVGLKTYYLDYSDVSTIATTSITPKTNSVGTVITNTNVYFQQQNRQFDPIIILAPYASFGINFKINKRMVLYNKIGYSIGLPLSSQVNATKIEFTNTKVNSNSIPWLGTTPINLNQMQLQNSNLASLELGIQYLFNKN